MRNLNILLLTTILAFTTNCGFKVVDRSKLSNFSIIDITTVGENRINYKLKNKLAFYKNEDSQKLVTLNIDTLKKKIVKERNIKNEITKYEISITAKVKFNLLENKNFKEFTLIKKGEYDVSEQYSRTLTSEKKLIDILVEELSQEILSEVTANLYDI